MEKWKEVQITQSQSAKVTSLMQNRLDPLGSSSCVGPDRPKPYIFTIPEYYRKDNKDIYRPFTTSIGPAYFKDPTLETMQDIKWTFLNVFLQHPKNAYPNNLEHYVEFVTEREVNIRMCYEEIFHRRNPISSEDFIQMILLDATFIISLFLAYNGEFEKITLPDNVMPLLAWITRDIYLMENQLPFFILYELFDTSFGSAFHKSFIEIACGCMCESVVLRSKDSIIYPIRSDDLTSIKHLLDLSRILCLHELDLNRKKKEDTALDVSHMMSDFSLKELQAAGVKIDPSENRQVVHIEYENGVLKIPKIFIYDNTESQLRNLLYFEQCHYPCRYFIAAYVCFMDKLINTTEDVEILIKNKILIYNGLGSNEAVAKLFNNLGKDINLNDNDYYYSDISRELNAYASKRWPRWKAVLKMQYFNYPWSIISVVAAGILFILTLLQTIAAFK